MMHTIFQLFFFAVLSGITSPSIASIESYFSSIKNDPNALYAFFKEMPKGGELHYHLAGGAYPETMFALASQGDYCLNPASQSIYKATNCDELRTSKISDSPERYQQLLRAWSMKDFTPGQESGHDHFFSTFYKFSPIVADFRPQLLADIMKRASNQHELYLEIMMLPDNAQSATFARLIKGKADFSAMRETLLSDHDFQKNINNTVIESHRILQQARHELGCSQSPQPAVCSVTVKFQYYVLREQPIENVFAQALNGFAASEKSQDIVGINLVQPEDGMIALRDYQEHMRIYQFLHTTYPSVHIALHAGELAPQDVPPSKLRYHIHEAIFTGHAERIGHGVDIAYENKANRLLEYMAKRPIPVEINLTSNHEILNISGRNHPLKYYLNHHVPIVLSTDDEGILRTDLTREYVEAVVHQGLDYPTIKTINRNALTYSFLPGNNIWADSNQNILVKDCQTLSSPSCQNFIKDSEKAKLQWQLETQLTSFESKY